MVEQLGNHSDESFGDAPMEGGWSDYDMEDDEPTPELLRKKSSTMAEIPVFTTEQNVLPYNMLEKQAML